MACPKEITRQAGDGIKRRSVSLLLTLASLLAFGCVSVYVSADASKCGPGVNCAEKAENESDGSGGTEVDSGGANPHDQDTTDGNSGDGDTDGDGDIDSGGTGTNAIGKAPASRFDVWPARPAVGSIVYLNTSGSDDADGYVTGYNWSFGDGSGDVEGSVVRHRFSEPGTYGVTLRVTDDAGNTTSTTKRLTVSASN
jgi:hypothetical protein